MHSLPRECAVRVYLLVLLRCQPHAAVYVGNGFQEGGISFESKVAK